MSWPLLNLRLRDYYGPARRQTLHNHAANAHPRTVYTLKTKRNTLWLLLTELFESTCYRFVFRYQGTKELYPYLGCGPPASNSHHPNYCIFGRVSRAKAAFPAGRAPFKLYMPFNVQFLVVYKVWRRFDLFCEKQSSEKNWSGPKTSSF